MIMGFRSTSNISKDINVNAGCSLFFSDVTAYTSALKASIRRQTEFQNKSVASSTISSVTTDDIFTNLLIQHGRKVVEDDFHLKRKESLRRYGQVSETPSQTLPRNIHPY